MNSTNFDHFSNNYKKLLDRSNALSGEGAEYFSEYKSCYVARIVGAAFRGRIVEYGCGLALLWGWLKRDTLNASIPDYTVTAHSARIVPDYHTGEDVSSTDVS